MKTEKICTSCGTTGKPKTYTPGNIIVELFLWCLWIIPGVIYTLWRVTNRKKVCRCCGSEDMIPLESPKGHQILKELTV